MRNILRLRSILKERDWYLHDEITSTRSVTEEGEDGQCFICLRDFRTKDGDDDPYPPCVPIKLRPCGHVVGRHCFDKHCRGAEEFRCVFCRRSLQLISSEYFLDRTLNYICDSIWFRICDSLSADRKIFTLKAIRDEEAYIRYKLLKGLQLHAKDFVVFEACHVLNSVCSVASSIPMLVLCLFVIPITSHAIVLLLVQQLMKQIGALGHRSEGFLNWYSQLEMIDLLSIFGRAYDRLCRWVLPISVIMMTLIFLAYVIVSMLVLYRLNHRTQR